MQTGTRANNNSRGKTVFIVLLTVLILALIGISAYLYYILGFETFYPGIVVDGIPLEGMTLEEGLSTIKTLNQPKLDKIKITLEHNENEWKYDYRHIDAYINVEEVVRKAYDVGRTGEVIERLKEIVQSSKEGKEYKTELTYDVFKLRDEVHAIASEINVEPIEADLTFHPHQKEKFAFTTHKIGKGMLVDQTMEELKKRVDAGNFSSYEIPTQELHPERVLDEVKTWTAKIAYYSTELTDNEDRNYNIELSSKAYSAVHLNPGEVYSFNEATGPRGAKEGYKSAPVIKEGKRYVDAPGGGNCQSSSTLYGAVLRADLEIVHRAPHSIPSGYTPPGTDATVDYPHADFKFKNNRDTPIFITRYIKDGRIHIEIYGKPSGEYDRIDVISNIISQTDVPAEKIVEDPNLFEGQVVVEYRSRAGIKAESYRVYYKDGKEIKRVKEANSSYPRIVGLRRVGTKPRPVETQSDPVISKGENESQQD